MKAFQGLIFIILGLIVVGVSMSLFTVDQRQQALVLQLGQPVGEIKEPGLHFKIPFIQNVRYFDRRILAVDPRPEQMVISSEAVGPATPRAEPEFDDEGEEITSIASPSIDDVSAEPIIVDTFARYKIVDPLQFLKTLGTTQVAEQRLQSILSDGTKAVLGNTTLEQLLSEERNRVMISILESVNNNIKRDALGIEIVDVRIVRADLTADLRQSTVRQMISELLERATETRAIGEERALEIRSTAEKERTVILAEAGRDSQILRGEGDETAIRTYTDAFNKDKEFYGFTRSLEAYRNTLANPETRLVLTPDSQFFRHFNSVD